MLATVTMLVMLASGGQRLTLWPLLHTRHDGWSADLASRQGCKTCPPPSAFGQSTGRGAGVPKPTQALGESTGNEAGLVPCRVAYRH